jgi:hypothetical protein
MISESQASNGMRRDSGLIPQSYRIWTEAIDAGVVEASHSE